MLERRSMLAGLAALPVVMLPPDIVKMLSADTIPTMAIPVVFDPAAFLADLTASGHGIYAYYDVPIGSEPAGPPSYLIRPPKGRGFGAA